MASELTTLGSVILPISTLGPPPLSASAAATGLQFQITYGAGVPDAAKAAISDVTSYLSAHFSNPVTIKIDIDWADLGSGILGETSNTFWFLNDYSTIPQRLAAAATSTDDAYNVFYLPKTNPVANSEWLATQAQIKAWFGYTPTSPDATITFGSSFPFDFDESDGIASGSYDFHGVAAHEITEVMGRILWQGSISDSGHPLYMASDLFKYAGAGAHVYSSGTTAGYFSVDGGTNSLANYNTNPNGDFGDWSSVPGSPDAALAFSPSGTVEPLTDTDLRALDVIGWNRVETASLDLDATAAGTDYSAQFYEPAGNATNMVGIAWQGPYLSDTGSTRFAQLKVSIADSQLAAGDKLWVGQFWLNGAFSIDLTNPSFKSFTESGWPFYVTSTNDGTTTSLVFTSSLSTLIDTAPINAYNNLIHDLAYASSSNAPVDGSTRTFQISANDGYGWSAPATFTVVVHATNDAPTGAVTIAGSPALGHVLTANTSTLNDPDGLGALSYQWSVGGTPVDGATSSTYTVQNADLNLNVTVTVSYTDGGGTSESVTSAATSAVTAGTSGADSVTGTGGDDFLAVLAGNDTVSGLAGNDVLIGGAGNDHLDGGDGSDLYVVDAAADHIAAEFADTGSAGADEVRFTATSGTLTVFAGDTGLESAVLGIGTAATADRSATSAAAINAAAAPNALLIEGNAGGNALTGSAFNDTLDGGAGTDTMAGGLGDDTYIVDSSSDVVTEASATGGIDTVLAAANFTLGTNVENLTLTGSAPINGVGNGIANIIVGNAAANVVDGKAGVDLLDGGDGSDIYFVGLATDHPAAEFADSGTSGIDEVRFAATRASTLTIFGGDTGIERVVIGTGTGAVAVSSGAGALGIDASAAPNALVLVGNAGANTIKATAFDDTIVGGAGNDILTGGAGADAFVFTNAPSARNNKDTITDFTPGTDMLQFAASVFTAAGAVGALDPNAFWSGAGVSTAHDASDRFIYNTTTGVLYYDADGAGGQAAVATALLGVTVHPALAAADIRLV